MERIPILRMGRFLLVTIQVDMHDRLATMSCSERSGMEPLEVTIGFVPAAAGRQKLHAPFDGERGPHALE